MINFDLPIHVRSPMMFSVEFHHEWRPFWLSCTDDIVMI